jgi:hypothetical protein
MFVKVNELLDYFINYIKKCNLLIKLSLEFYQKHKQIKNIYFD